MQKLILKLVLTMFFIWGFVFLLIHNSEKESAWQSERLARFACYDSGLGSECD